MHRKEGANRSPSEGGHNRSLPFRDDSQLAPKRPPARVQDTAHESPPKKKKRKNKTQRDLHGNLNSRPKRPLTGYNRFFKEERVKWKEEQSKLEETEVPSDDKKHAFLTMGKEISARWVRLPRDQKEKYTAEYDKELLQYRIDVDKYNREKEVAADEGEEKSDGHSTKVAAQTKSPVDSAVCGSQETPNLHELQYQQILTSQINTLPSTFNMASPLNLLLQQRQLGMLLQQRVLEQQIQRESSLQSLNILLEGNGIARAIPTLPSSSALLNRWNTSGTVPASAYTGLSLATGNAQAQMQDYSRGGLVPARNPYNVLPGSSRNLLMGDFSTRTNDQLLLSYLLQQQQQDEAKYHSSPNNF